MAAVGNVGLRCVAQEARVEQELQGDVQCALHFLLGTCEEPFVYTYPREDGGKQSHLEFEARAVMVEDGRGCAETLALDKHGLIALQQSTALTHQAFLDFPQRVTKEYYEEIRDIVQLVTGASCVEVFAHHVRSGHAAAKCRGFSSYVQYAHNDYTTQSGPQRARDLYSPLSPIASEAEVAELMQGRYMIINVWRNIGNTPVVMMPLAVCDGSTLEPDDCVRCSVMHKDTVGYTYAVRFNERQRWLYFSGLQRDEVVIMKCYDSLEEPGVTRWGGHTAFMHPGTPDDAPYRDSIDTRCLAFFKATDEVRTALPVGELVKKFVPLGANKAHPP